MAFLPHLHIAYTHFLLNFTAIISPAQSHTQTVLVDWLHSRVLIVIHVSMYFTSLPLSQYTHYTQSEPKPPLPHENLLINELIRDYLEFNRYKYTCSVLLAGT